MILTAISHWYCWLQKKPQQNKAKQKPNDSKKAKAEIILTLLVLAFVLVNSQCLESIQFLNSVSAEVEYPFLYVNYLVSVTDVDHRHRGHF